MSENLKPNEAENNQTEPEIVVNNYGETKDSAVVIEEAERTVLLTEKETIVIEKDPMISVVPKNRPRKVYGGMWGVPETTSVALGLLAILAVVILFVFFALPKQKELEENRAKRDKLEQDLTSANQKYGNITTIKSRVSELITSANDFESRFLKPASIGRAALYQQLNGLISAYGLVNTTGPDYVPLEINSPNNNRQQAEKESGRAKFQSLFPGDYVTTTIEGSYQNLRRFVREIETNNQFIIISAIELEPADAEEKKELKQTISQQQPQNQPTINTGRIDFQTLPNQPQTTQTPKIVRGKTRGESVSLRLEMAVYYRRPNFQPTQIDKTEAK